jgi:transcriptional regulator with XRE-family HTH domain
VNISQNLGSNIRARRKELRISQEELARRCNIDRSYMGQIERGTANPSLAVIDAIAHSLVESISSSTEKASYFDPTVALALISPTIMSLEYQRIAPRT